MKKELGGLLACRSIKLKRMKFSNLSMSKKVDGTKERIKIVKNGYEQAANPYRQQKDETLVHLTIFQEWLSLLGKKQILELGCGSGFPIGSYLLQNGKNYLGIDLSPAQITLARTEFKTNNDNFQIAEMLEFCNTAESNTFGGIIALFSIFHLPRKHHVDLFEQIKRILIPGAPFLFTCSPSSGEGVSSNWLQADTMYWSNFSNRWYEQTLKELQFHPVMKYRDEKIFNGKKEITWYLLYRNLDEYD